MYVYAEYSNKATQVRALIFCSSTVLLHILQTAKAAASGVKLEKLEFFCCIMFNTVC